MKPSVEMFLVTKSICFLLIFTCVKTQNLWNFNDFRKYSILADATREVIEEFFLKRCSTLNIIKTPVDTTKFDRVITKILIENRGAFAVRLGSKFIENRRKKFNIILIENIEAFRSFNEKINSKVFNYQGFYLLVLTDGKLDEIEEIFTTLWKKKLYNINLLVKENENVRLMTFLPFGGSVCGDTRPRTINVFRNGNFERKNFSFFPEKFSNMKNCRLKVAALEDRVAVIRKRRNRAFKYSGYEMNLLSELSKSLNFGMKINFLASGHPWGSTNSNGSFSSGALSEAYRGHTDISIGNFGLTLTRTNLIDNSVPYYSFPIVFVISPGRKLTELEKLLMPFSLMVWILLAATIFLALVLIALLNFSKRNTRNFIYGFGVQHPVTNLLIAILGGSQTKLPQRNFSRFLLMMFLIFCLVMRNAYQGALFKFLQSDNRHKNVQTINDMIDQKFDIFMYKDFIYVFDSQPRSIER